VRPSCPYALSPQVNISPLVVRHTLRLTSIQIRKLSKKSQARKAKPVAGTSSDTNEVLFVQVRDAIKQHSIRGRLDSELPLSVGTAAENCTCLCHCQRVLVTACNTSDLVANGFTVLKRHIPCYGLKQHMINQPQRTPCSLWNAAVYRIPKPQPPI
jgi:hypothetical protein